MEGLLSTGPTPSSFQGYGQDSVFWHPCMSGYLTEPIKDNENFQVAVRKVQNGLKCDLKRDSSLDALLQGYGRDSNCYLLLSCQGTLIRRVPYGTIQRQQWLQTSWQESKNWQNSKKGAFRRRRQSWRTLVRGMGETIRASKKPPGTSKHLKTSKKVIMKETAALTSFSEV